MSDIPGTSYGLPSYRVAEVSSDEECPRFAYRDEACGGHDPSMQSESDSETKGLDSTEESARFQGKGKRKNKKNKKQRRKHDIVQSNEMDRSVEEVDALFGELSTNSFGSYPLKRHVPVSAYLSIQPKYLTWEEETPKRMRPEYYEDYRNRKTQIVRMPPNPEFPKDEPLGLSMSFVGRNNGCSYFVIDHSAEYQEMHQNYLDAINLGEKVPLEESQKNLHVEGLLEGVDSTVLAEEYKAASSIYEQIIIYYQYIYHPCFDIADKFCRLEYKIMENRSFHVVVFKYMAMLLGSGYPRNALELGKVLLNLDPNDPLAVCFIIDISALRAREFKWLMDFVESWTNERNSIYLFNFKFSYALAAFNLAKKNKSTDFSRADLALQEAMATYPTVMAELLKVLPVKLETEQHKRSLFYNDYDNMYPTNYFIDIAITNYANMVASNWCEAPVLDWLLKNIHVVISKYDNEPNFKKRVDMMAINTVELFSRQCPVEIRRNLILMRPLAKLVANYEMPHIYTNRIFDPVPPVDTVNRYCYNLIENYCYSSGIQAGVREIEQDGVERCIQASVQAILQAILQAGFQSAEQAFIQACLATGIYIDIGLQAVMPAYLQAGFAPLSLYMHPHLYWRGIIAFYPAYIYRPPSLWTSPMEFYAAANILEEMLYYDPRYYPDYYQNNQ